MDFQKLCGKLLGYPDCCIDGYLQKCGDFQSRCYYGFFPCDNHEDLSLEYFENLLGRSLEFPPREFPMFTYLTEDLDISETLTKGLEIYSKAGKRDFFLACVEACK